MVLDSGTRGGRTAVKRTVNAQAIEDQKLMLDEQRLSDDGPNTARSEQACDRYEKADEKYGEITHH